jgi:hypothetical protein
MESKFVNSGDFQAINVPQRYGIPEGRLFIEGLRALRRNFFPSKNRHPVYENCEKITQKKRGGKKIYSPTAHSRIRRSPTSQEGSFFPRGLFVFSLRYVSPARRNISIVIVSSLRIFRRCSLTSLGVGWNTPGPPKVPCFLARQSSFTQLEPRVIADDTISTSCLIKGSPSRQLYGHKIISDTVGKKKVFPHITPAPIPHQLSFPWIIK